MTKWMPYEAVKTCPHHIKIKDECEQWLSSFGHFEKEEVIEQTGSKYIASAIRWDYIVHWIEEDKKYFLIPVAGSYFPKKRSEIKFKRENDEHKVPEKYIATGHGKRTAGFVAGNTENGHFVRYVIKTKFSNVYGGSTVDENGKKVSPGRVQKAIDVVDKARAQGIPVQDLLPSRATMIPPPLEPIVIKDGSDEASVA